MSQHTFTSIVDADHYYVQMGWDKTNQAYYGRVYKWITDPLRIQNGYWNEDQPTWSSLGSVKKLSLNEIAHEITKLGIDLPELLLRNVAKDRYKSRQPNQKPDDIYSLGNSARSR